jgi:hypothetical protein
MAKMTENDKIARYGAIVQLVGSRTKPDKTPYEVRLKDGIHSCNCTGFVMSKEVPKSCKHIKGYLVEKGKTQKVAELTEVQIVEKCLRTAGCYDPIKDSVRVALTGMTLEATFKHKLERLAQALLPYFGGNGPVENTFSSEPVVRTIYLD